MASKIASFFTNQIVPQFNTRPPKGLMLPGDQWHGTPCQPAHCVAKEEPIELTGSVT